jgi:hypothetical protein
MNDRIHKIENDVQDRNSIAWKKLCQYVDIVAKENREEFSPLDELGQELFSQIYTLPESISKLKAVKKMWLYGSNLKRIPPEIGQMESLEYFDPYTSYNLHWFPYEIINCKKLVDSRVSTRVLFGNYKNRMRFPLLTHNPVKYFGENVNCSICNKEITYEQTNQLWINVLVGTDTLPLLANLCSKECESKLAKPEIGYVQFPHKGGADLKQPTNKEWNEISQQNYKQQKTETQNEISQKVISQKEEPKLLRLIRKIWE